jgi:beta-glucanase (GH16 family)
MKTISILRLIPCIAYVLGQTHTICDPLKIKCSENKALGTFLSIDFRRGPSPWFIPISATDKIRYNDHGIEFDVSKSGDNPTIQSNFYIMFGRIEVILKASPGRGIVSSFVLQSDDLDEIDMEWIGSDSHQYQSNYFSKGDTTTFDRGEFHNCHSPQTTYHNYTVDWKNTHTSWYVDGTLVRLLPSNAAKGYPQTPMLVRIGSWAGGDVNNPPGTIEWAGGPTDYTQGPFIFTVESLHIEDYSTGTAYLYGDQSGDWTSIQAVNGAVQALTMEQFEEEINLLADIPVDLAMHVVPGTSVNNLDGDEENDDEEGSDSKSEGNKKYNGDIENLPTSDKNDSILERKGQELILDGFDSKQKVIRHIGAILNNSRTPLLALKNSSNVASVKRNSTLVTIEHEQHPNYIGTAEMVQSPIILPQCLFWLVLVVIG